MQDRYAGDVGDFGKLGLLRKIAGSGLTIGVNWYHTFKPEEHDRGDGKHIGYLHDRSFRGCDDELLKVLQIDCEGKPEYRCPGGGEANLQCLLLFGNITTG